MTTRTLTACLLTTGLLMGALPLTSAAQEEQQAEVTDTTRLERELERTFDTLKSNVQRNFSELSRDIERRLNNRLEAIEEEFGTIAEELNRQFSESLAELDKEYAKLKSEIADVATERAFKEKVESLTDKMNAVQKEVERLGEKTREFLSDSASEAEAATPPESEKPKRRGLFRR